MCVFDARTCLCVCICNTQNALSVCQEACGGHDACVFLIMHVHVCECVCVLATLRMRCQCAGRLVGGMVRVCF